MENGTSVHPSDTLAGAGILAKPSLKCFFVQAKNIYYSLREQIIGEEVLHHKGHSEKILGYAVVDFQGGA